MRLQKFQWYFLYLYWEELYLGHTIGNHTGYGAFRLMVALFFPAMFCKIEEKARRDFSYLVFQS